MWEEAHFSTVVDSAAVACSLPVVQEQEYEDRHQLLESGSSYWNIYVLAHFSAMPNIGLLYD